MNTMGGYHDLYLQKDLLLLVYDVFEKFISTYLILWMRYLSLF